MRTLLFIILFCATCTFSYGFEYPYLSQEYDLYVLDSFPSNVVTYYYDDGEEMPGGEYSYSYNSNGQIYAITHKSIWGTDKTTYAYDSKGRLSTSRYGSSIGKWTFDSYGMFNSYTATYKDWENKTIKESHSFKRVITRDSLNRVTKVERQEYNATKGYEYDKREIYYYGEDGQLDSIRFYEINVTLGGINHHYQTFYNIDVQETDYSNVDELVYNSYTSNYAGYIYDHKFEYDQNGKVVKYEKTYKSGSKETTNYEYEGEMLVKKTVSSSPTSKEVYLYDQTGKEQMYSKYYINSKDSVWKENIYWKTWVDRVFENGRIVEETYYEMNDTVPEPVDRYVYSYPITYWATITCYDNNNSELSGAKVTINNKVYTTDTDGIAKAKLIKGTYTVTVSADGYESAEKKLTISDADATVSVKLNPIIPSYAVTFLVKDEFGNPVANAIVTAGTKNIATNNAGKAILMLADGEYSYEVIAQNYMSNSGSFTVESAEISVTDIVLIKKLKTVTFSIPAEFDLSKNISVKINDDLYTPDNNGVITAELVNGDYSYYILVDGAESAPVAFSVTEGAYLNFALTKADLNIIDETALGKNDITVRFFPVPADNSLTIEAGLEIISYQITNIIGEVVKKECVKPTKSINCQLNTIDSGYYFVKLVFQNNCSQVIKVTKK